MPNTTETTPAAAAPAREATPARETTPAAREATPAMVSAAAAKEATPAIVSAAAAREATPAMESAAAAADGATGATETQENTETVLPASHWADNAPDDDDADSTLGSDAASSTASITSSILAYRTINGRTYHAERGNAEYWCANDEQALESMDLYAHLCYLLNGRKLFKAPLDRNTLKKALDIGTGTGVWAMDFADEFPDCQIVGTDISPIQPSWVPPNLKFEIEDCTQDWTYPPNSMDYVHLRLLYGSIPDWDHLFEQAYRTTKPGGWIESFEASPEAYCDDGSVPDDSAIKEWGKFFMEGGRKIGRTFRILHDDIQVKAMEKLGMEEVHVLDLKCPCGAWPKDPDMLEIGRVAQATLEQDYEGYVGLMANISYGRTKEETAVYCAHIRSEYRNTKHHAYFKFRIVWGRKPLNATN